MELEEYKEKRDWTKTPEPKGDGSKVSKLVIQQHEAKRAGNHYDWRIPYKGVLKSFVTKKLPKKGEKILAIPTEDHPLAYASFEGEIPEGTYGAGKVTKKGEYSFKLNEFSSSKISFEILEEDMEGKYTLIKFKNGFLMHRG